MSTTRQRRPGLRGRYEDLLWGMMDRLDLRIDRAQGRHGRRDSVSRHGRDLPRAVSGLRDALVRPLRCPVSRRRPRDLQHAAHRAARLCRPARQLETGADAIASGEVDAVDAVGAKDASGIALAGSDQPDEIGSLVNSFAEVERYLGTVSAQAESLAAQEFDDPALDEDVPGAFGDSLDEMAANLEAYTTELESLVDAFGDAAGRARDGDLTATIDDGALATDEDRYVELVGNYNRLVTTLGGTVGEVASFTGDVADASGDVRASMDEVDDASEEVARSVQEISNGAAEQTEELESVSGEMSTLSATVEEIAASADDAAATARNAAERGQTGREEAAEAIEELEALEASIAETATAVEDLVDRVGEIDEIASVIDGIAEETNLLALNASIEAARAEGSGDGFAVVADEVKALAEETREEAAEISGRIDEVQAASAETAADVDEMESQVSDGVDTIESTLREFEEVVEDVTTVDETVQEISEATDDQARTTQEVVDMVDDIASVSRQTATEAETAAAAAEEQTATVSEVTRRVHALSDQSDELLATLDEFDVPESDEDYASPSGVKHPGAPAAGADDD